MKTDTDDKEKIPEMPSQPDYLTREGVEIPRIAPPNLYEVTFTWAVDGSSIATRVSAKSRYWAVKRARLRLGFTRAELDAADVHVARLLG